MSISTNLEWDVPDNGADDDTWGLLLRAILTSQDAMFAGATSTATIPSLFQNYLSGLTLSTAGSSATFGIAAGVATDSANAAIMRLASAYTKTTSAWAVGSGNGSLDTGSIANNTWYHVWLIQRSGTKVVDVLISTSATSPTMPANYDRKRRIGAMKTNGSAQWTAFVQDGDTFLWSSPPLDWSNVTPASTNAILKVLSVPTGVLVTALANIELLYFSATSKGYYSSPSQTDISAASVIDMDVSSAMTISVKDKRILTNTSGEIRTRHSNTGCTYYIQTDGWIDPRGKNG